MSAAAATCESWPSMDDWTWRTLRSIALQESRALRAYAQLGITPNTRKMIWPWEDNYPGDHVMRTITEMEHGTFPCYRQHLRLGTEPCQPCKDAMNAHKRAERVDSRRPIPA